MLHLAPLFKSKHKTNKTIHAFSSYVIMKPGICIILNTNTHVTYLCDFQILLNVTNARVVCCIE